MNYYWLSFCDTSLAEGEQFLGAGLFPGDELETALTVATLTKQNPGGEVLGLGPIPADNMPASYPTGILLSRAQIAEFDSIEWSE